MTRATIDDVADFWENNPLFSGESKFKTGSREFFEEHKSVYYDDVFAGDFDHKKFIPNYENNAKVLDLGCGVGFWTIEIQQYMPTDNFYSADLTKMAIETTEKRLKTYQLNSSLSQQNAESLTFKNEFFDFINCQGVIHHTPRPEKAIEEIARVLKSGGKASISVYYKNFVLRNWNFFRFFGKILFNLNAKLKGRGRENIFKKNDVNDIVKLYDGDKNPIGIAYSKNELRAEVEKFFNVENEFLYFFPARSLPIKLPKSIHKFLANKLGFMIHLNLVKK